MKDMSQYDATEVHPIHVDEEGNENNCTGNEEDANRWSVMLHLKDGGIDCIADCANEEDALFIANAIDFQQRVVRPDWR